MGKLRKDPVGLSDQRQYTACRAGLEAEPLLMGRGTGQGAVVLVQQAAGEEDEVEDDLQEKAEGGMRDSKRG